MRGAGQSVGSCCGMKQRYVSYPNKKNGTITINRDFHLFFNLYDFAGLTKRESFKNLQERKMREDKARADNELLTMKSSSSFGSSSKFDQSQKTGLSGSQSARSSNGDNSDVGDGLTNFTRAISEDPLILGLEKLFDDAIEDLNVNGDARIQYIKRAANKKSI